MGKRFTKILTTLGPASSSSQELEKMIKAGVDMVRLNFSHGDHASHLKMIKTIRSINKDLSQKVQILQDLEGFRIRVGHLKKPIELVPGAKVYFAYEFDKAVNPAKKTVIPFDYIGDLSVIKKDMLVFIDDGHLCLKVLSSTKKKVALEVVQGGVLKQRKGINIPDLKLKSNILLEKDKRDLDFGIEQGVDFIAQSFVRNKGDIKRIVDLVKPRLPNTKVIAKIESKEGVRNLDAIIDACDGIMIARGDLGVSLPIYQIPIIQKHIIRRCTRKKKIAITATQMLESMTVDTRPTRAEVSDVANAILDGTDYVMLSGETAVGVDPAGCVKMMRQIIEYTEQNEK